jgi:DUF4097 and DUF4098 domain-containing protein YvlB
MSKKGMYMGIFWLAALAANAQVSEKITIPLSSPGERGLLEVGQVNGDIIVEAYSGSEVLIEARVAAPKEKDKDKNKSGRDLPPGMKRIESNPVEISASEDDNEVQINTESWKRRTDLTIQVPANFDLDISTVHGVIEVTGLNGELEVSNVNGPITMQSIEGSVLSNTVNGDIEVFFKKITPDAQMSFVTLNGDIDVTFPANTKMTAKMKSDRGEIFTDFDMKTETAREEIKRGDDCDCEYEVSINSFTKGTANGGGPEFTFKNMNGDIIIRKGN